MQLFLGRQKVKKWGANLIAQSKPRNSQFSLLLAALLLLTLPSSLLGFTAPTSKDIPKSITLKGKEFSLENIKNPFSSDPETIKEGGEIYIKNCFLCHGDLLDGKGLFGKSFFPAPANFTQKNSVVSKTPAYAFWRIMKGGKGLPEKFEPWNSAMPAWEGILSQEEVWKTILYIYETVKDQIAKAKEELANETFEVYDAYHEVDKRFSKVYSWCPNMQINPVIGADMNIYSCHDKAYNLETGVIGSCKSQRFKDFWFSEKSNFFKINPSLHCNHHCMANLKNGFILDYLNVDKGHLAFV